ncbi:MAG: AraC family transcriptional regulator [Oscillospiraceae bacterium]|nr:AraC family transcriptional regulator [Oscillospiraceae bacterium]
MAETHLDDLCPYIREVGLQGKDSWRIQRRIYDHQFLYCFAGVAHVLLREQYHRITPGDVLIIQPNVPHQLWMDEEQPGELCWFHCDFFLFPDRHWVYEVYNTAERYITLFGAELQYKEHIRENPVFSGGRTLPEVSSLAKEEGLAYCFRTMYRAYTHGDALWQLTARRCFYEILETVLRQGETDRSANKRYVVNQMKAYVAKHYFEPLTTPQICEGTGLNPEYASKLFRRETGLRLVEYISRFRLNQAKKLLIYPDLSIADVAEMAGFSSENYFCSVLKKLEGRTPAKMRAHLLDLLTEEEP